MTQTTNTNAKAIAHHKGYFRTKKQKKDFWFFVLFAGPNILLIATFSLAPLISNIYFSFLNWTLGASTAVWAGFDNYIRFFTSGDAATVLSTTAIFAIFTVGGSMILGLLFALILNKNLKGKNFARATVFSPYILSGVAVGLLWLYIFDPGIGILGSVIRSFGGVSPQWMSDPTLSLIMVMVVYVWKNLGYCAIVYLAGLQSLPKDILEAASIDGASALRQFFSIKLPLLSPTTFFLLITTALSSLQAFDLLKIMTPRGNGTRTLVYESYLQAFDFSRAGYSASISVILFIILLLITIFNIRYTEKKVHYS